MNPKHLLFPLILTPLLSFTPILASPQLHLAKQSEEQISVDVYKKASPSVVTITTQEGSTGSGFIISSDGLVITNAHVLEGAASPVTVITADNTQLTADIVGFDPNGKDIAAIKLRNVAKVKPLRLANAQSVQVGQSVYAIGSPFGRELAGTFTTGIVSRIDRPTGRIQHSAPIHQGNSGGPLLNSKAEVIGINTEIKLSPVIDPETKKVIGVNRGFSGIGYAIPVQDIATFLVAVKQGNTRTAFKQQVIPISLPLNGTPVQGKITAQSPLFVDQRYYDYYFFKGQRGQKITIQMTSQQIDPTLVLLYSDPQQETITELITNHDISPNNPNAQLSLTLPKDGFYLIRAKSFEPGATGSYSIKAFEQ